MASTVGAMAVVGAVAPTSGAETPVRILVVGDSVAQGSAGDWTWRYRLWQELTRQGVPIDLVGPRSDVYDNVHRWLCSPEQVSGEDPEPHPACSEEYADPAFDRDHAARWGMALSMPDESLADLVAAYRPDVVIETRGINDLVWLGSDSAKVAREVRAEVVAARQVDPEVDFVLAELPQTWLGAQEAGLSGVAAYNQRQLPGLVADLSTPASSVVAAHTTGLTELVDTWDAAHLTASGEVIYAAGIVDALAGLGIGTSYPRPLPPTTNGHWGPAALDVEVGTEAATLHWTPAPGAQETYVWQRDVTLDEPWQQRATVPLATSWPATGLAAGHTYAFRLQSGKGSAVDAGFSPEVRVVPYPAVPDAPTGVVATPGIARLTVDWSPVPDASWYELIWTRRSTGATERRSVAGGPVLLDGLGGDEWYDLTVVPYNAGGRGPAVAVAAHTEPLPAPPGAVAVTVRPGAHRLGLSWAPAPSATGYDVSWVGRHSGDTGSLQVVGTTVDLTGLRAGEPYRVDVTASNEGGAGPTTSVRGVPTGPVVPSVTRLAVQPRGHHRAEVRWRGRTRATSYVVWVRQGGRWRSRPATSETSLTLRHLSLGPLAVKVRSWHDDVAGEWSSVVRTTMR